MRWQVLLQLGRVAAQTPQSLRRPLPKCSGKSAGSEEGGGQQSNRLGRGYADGGIVRGPGGPKSDI